MSRGGAGETASRAHMMPGWARRPSQRIHRRGNVCRSGSRMTVGRGRQCGFMQVAGTQQNERQATVLRCNIAEGSTCHLFRAVR